MLRRYLFLVLCCASILLTSCIKDLEKEGIYDETRFFGVVLDERTHQPLADAMVVVTNGSVDADIVHPKADGSFEVMVDVNKIANDYFILIETDSLYQSYQCLLNDVPLGIRDYNLDTIYLVGPNVPLVTTNMAVDVTAVSAHCFGTIESDGASSIIEEGFVYSTMQYPTISNEKVSASYIDYYFDCMLPLQPHTTYYIRAYAINGMGVGYGNQISVTTLDGLSTVTTSGITNITVTSATGGGEVTDDGGFAVQMRGICWSTTPNPTINNSHTVDGSGLGSFTSSMTNLEPNTTYYVRAYAKSAAGTAYGSQIKFATMSGLPTVNTHTVTSISAHSAVGGGEVLDDGGYPVVRRGVCYSTTPDPTLSDAHTTDGAGLGVFVSQLTNLTSGTSYYYRAYATNGVGTVYGEQKVFVAW